MGRSKAGEVRREATRGNGACRRTYRIVEVMKWACVRDANMSGRNIARLIAACGVSLGAGLIGSLAAVGDGFNSWYSTIEKPTFTPPNWVFGPVWTILYLLMGVAAFLVWRKGPCRRWGTLND